MAVHTRILCDRCGLAVPREAHYRVRIDIVADPSVPDLTTEELEETDFDWKVGQLLDEMKDASAEELEDDVAKRLEYRVCRSCRRALIRNPLGRTAE